MSTKTNFWVGVVEDRNDPLLLGRCRVRIFGIHNDDLTILPTKDLPWAIPLQPITSAAISGKGTTPIGPLEGTWVMGWFMDGDDMQQPVMLGTLAGIQSNNPLCASLLKESEQDNYLKDSSGEIVRDGSGNPIQVGEQTNTSPATRDYITSSLPPLNADQVKSLMDSIGRRESSSTPGGNVVTTKLSYEEIRTRTDKGQYYGAYNKKKSEFNTNPGFVGKYQIGYETLVTLNYVKNLGKGNNVNSALLDSSNWLGKNGLKSLDNYFNSPEVQEKIMFENLKFNYNVLKNRQVIQSSGSPGETAGYLAAAHLLGAGGAIKLSKGSDGADDFGTKGSEYFTIGNNSVNGRADTPTEEVPTREESTTENNLQFNVQKGFRDPNFVYPTCEYSGQPDTNKLARGIEDHNSIDTKNNNRSVNVSVANSEKVWSEPPSPFAARYPYNQVLETEAGHILEFDSTPGNERINIFHKSGTFIEVDVNGSMVRKVIGDQFELVDNNSYTYVKGSQNVTIDGSSKILVKNNADIQVIGTTNIVGHNDVSISSAGRLDLIGETVNIVSKNGSYMLSETGPVKLQGNEVTFFSKDKIAAKSKSGIFMHAESKFHVEGGLEMKLNAAVIQQKMGATLIRDVILPTVDPPQKLTPSDNTKSDKPYPKNVQEDYLYDEVNLSNLDEALKFRNERLVNDIITNTDFKVQKSDSQFTTRSFAVNEPKSGVQGRNRSLLVPCEEFVDFEKRGTFPSSLRLSTNFTLGALTTKTAAGGSELRAQRNLTRAEICCNLKYLAEVVLEPVKAKYPNMFITSGFRQIDSRNSNSDHGIGCAADIQFRGIPISEYYDIARWMRSNLPYKQILLEYLEKSNKTLSCWIHVAYEKSGKVSNMPIATFINHQAKYPSQLVKLA